MSVQGWISKYFQVISHSLNFRLKLYDLKVSSEVCTAPKNRFKGSIAQQKNVPCLGLDRITPSGKTNVSNNTVLSGHVDKFQEQMVEVVNIQEALAGYRAALEQVKGRLLITLQVEAAESKLMATWGESIKDWNNLENFLQNAEVQTKSLDFLVMCRG